MMLLLGQWWWSGHYLGMDKYYVIFSHDSMEGLVGRVDKADRLPDDDVARHCAQDWSWRRHFQEKILGIGRSLFPQKLTVESRKILRWPKNSLRVFCADEEMGSLDLLMSSWGWERSTWSRWSCTCCPAWSTQPGQPAASWSCWSCWSHFGWLSLEPATAADGLRQLAEPLSMQQLQSQTHLFHDGYY